MIISFHLWHSWVSVLLAGFGTRRPSTEAIEREHVWLNKCAYCASTMGVFSTARSTYPARNCVVAMRRRRRWRRRRRRSRRMDNHEREGLRDGETKMRHRIMCRGRIFFFRRHAPVANTKHTSSTARKARAKNTEFNFVAILCVCALVFRYGAARYMEIRCIFALTRLCFLTCLFCSLVSGLLGMCVCANAFFRAIFQRRWFVE